MGADVPHHMGLMMEELALPKLLTKRNLIYLICFVSPQLILLIFSVIFRLHIYVIIHTISLFVLLSMIIDQRIPMFMSSSLINIFCFILFIKMKKFESAFALNEFVFFYIAGSIVYVFNIFCSIILYLIVDKDGLAIFIINSINNLTGYAYKHERSVSKYVGKIVEDYNKVLTNKGEIFGREFFDAIDWPLLGFSKIKSMYDCEANIKYNDTFNVRHRNIELNTIRIDNSTQTNTFVSDFNQNLNINNKIRRSSINHNLPIIGIQNNNIITPISNTPIQATPVKLTTPAIVTPIQGNTPVQVATPIQAPTPVQVTPVQAIPTNVTPVICVTPANDTSPLPPSQIPHEDSNDVTITPKIPDRHFTVKTTSINNQVDQSLKSNLTPPTLSPVNLMSDTPLKPISHNYEMGFCVHHPSNVDHKVELYESDFTISNSTITALSMPITPGTKSEIDKADYRLDTNISAYTEEKIPTPQINKTPERSNEDSDDVIFPNIESSIRRPKRDSIMDLERYTPKSGIHSNTSSIKTPNVTTQSIRTGSRSSSTCRSKIPDRHGVPGRLDPSKYNSSPLRHTALKRYNDNQSHKCTPSRASTPNREGVFQNNNAAKFENCVGGSGLGRLDDLWSEIASKPTVADNLDPTSQGETNDKIWTSQPALMTNYTPKKLFEYSEF